MYLRLERKASPFIAWSVEREASLYCMPSCIRSEVRLTPYQPILCSDFCEKRYHGYSRQSSRILYSTEAR